MAKPRYRKDAKAIVGKPGTTSPLPSDHSALEARRRDSGHRTGWLSNTKQKMREDHKRYVRDKTGLSKDDY